MNLKNIDIFLINKDYKNIYKKRLSNILRKNKKRLSGKAILFTDDDFYKSSDFESIKRIIDGEYKFVCSKCERTYCRRCIKIEIKADSGKKGVRKSKKDKKSNTSGIITLYPTLLPDLQNKELFR